MTKVFCAFGRNIIVDVPLLCCLQLFPHGLLFVSASGSVLRN